MKKWDHVVFLRGGLGNQLFQIQAGLGLIQSGKRVAFSDIFLKSRPVRGTYLRENYAQRLGLNQHRLSWLASLLLRLTLSLIYLESRFLRKPIKFFRILLSSHNVVDLKTLAAFKFLDIPGLPNSHQEPTIQQIRSLLESKRHRRVEGQLPDSFIAVHIRLGDYTQLAGTYGRACYHYFREAIRLAQQHLRGGQPRTVVLFSDSPELIDIDLLEGNESQEIIVASNLRLGVLEELYALSEGDAIVCSNSSFSWWAAALSEAKLVYIPVPFEGPNLELPVYFQPSHWHEVEKCLVC